MPDHCYEIEITARDKDGQSSKHVEYRSTSASTPTGAVDEVYKALEKTVRERCREVAQDA